MGSRARRQFFGAAVGLALAWLAFVLPAPTPARGAPAALDITVTSSFDATDFLPGDGVCETAHNNHVCTLRAAVQEADARAGADSIILQPGTTYVLGLPGNENNAVNGDLDITETVTIVGSGSDSTIINGNGGGTGDRVFQITGTVVISGVTILNGHSAGEGGGILNTGQLTLINSLVMSNTADGGVARGGGLANFGALTVTNSTVHGNRTVNFNQLGGGIENGGFGPLTLISSTVSGNTTLGIGGGIVGSATLINSTVSGNHSGDRGGGIFKIGTNLLIINSTISGNTSDGEGGGIVGTATLINSTVSGNHSNDQGGGIFKPNDALTLTLINSTVSGNFSYGGGGGIYMITGTTSLFNVTITDNHANVDESGNDVGGGVAVAGGRLNFTNSIIAWNDSIGVPGPLLNLDDCSGTIKSLGNNLVYSVDVHHCTITGPAPLMDMDPLLGPLQDHGGPTRTHALLLGSPAIDGAILGGCTDNLGAPLTTDQRGQPRPLPGQGLCDLGAFETNLLRLPLLKR